MRPTKHLIKRIHISLNFPSRTCMNLFNSGRSWAYKRTCGDSVSYSLETYLTHENESYLIAPKGLANLGNIVADGNVSLFSRAGSVLRKQILLLGKQKCFCLETKTFLLPGQKFCVRNICFPVKPPRETKRETLFPQKFFLV